MTPVPLFLMRGQVYRVHFEADDPGREGMIQKYFLCLQEGSIVHNRQQFVGVLLTTCKDNNKPRTYPWTVYVSPAESGTEFGVLVNCSQIHAVPKSDIIEPAYRLDNATMEKVNRALQFGIGTIKVEDIKKKQSSE